MSRVTQAIFLSWSINPGLAFLLAITSVIYLRGWLVLHRITPSRFPLWRLLAFIGGAATLWFAIASPLDSVSSLLLSAHMIQHLLLLSVAPPLVLLGSPLLPLLRGLPRTFARDGLGPFLVWPPLRKFSYVLTHPAVCWVAMAVTLLAWHVPAAFEAALRSPGWHKAEHACFFVAALLFWWPVVLPFPSRPIWPLWTRPIYLLAADLLNTLLSAILTFSEHVLYPTYAAAPRLFGTNALTDQATAGVIMWVPGSLVFLIPAAMLAIQYLSPSRSLVRPVRTEAGTLAERYEGVGLVELVLPKPRGRVKLGAPGERARFDVLAMPLIGRFLRARSSRRVVQAVLLIIALAVIADGFLGPQVSSLNLAGVLPWTYWRAATVVVLLALGNFFCMACPFMLPRELGRRLRLKPRPWPRWLRSKWLAVGLLVLFFWAYEAFGLWDKPIWTAWLILSYFLAAFVLDAFFQGASFCKYVCPIGQFQFITSLISPLEVKVREPGVCANCKTHDCLRGNHEQRGCETELYLPRKRGNLDCTFCFDCARACPHHNVGLLAVAPGIELVHDPQRSSLGRLARRFDVAALALVLVFAAFAGAASMSAPVLALEHGLVLHWGLRSPLPVVSGFFLISLVLGPVITLALVVMAGRSTTRVATPIRELLSRFALALVPLGVAMWAAHFLFHLLSGYATGWPVLQRAAADWGLRFLGRPDMALSAMRLGADSLLTLQTLLLGGGLLLTLYVGWGIARDCVPCRRSAIGLLTPWAALAIALYLAGVWILLQPMQMRGLTGS
jgi:cytochrome c oxidase assembly factor CtaG/polyferredoxin